MSVCLVARGVPFPTPGLCPAEWLNPHLLCLLFQQVDSLQLVQPMKPHNIYLCVYKGLGFPDRSMVNNLPALQEQGDIRKPSSLINAKK